MFADETNVFINGCNVESLVDMLNIELYKLATSLHVNKLSLNLSKTHYIIFGSGNSPCKSDRNIIINVHTIQRLFYALLRYCYEHLKRGRAHTMYKQSTFLKVLAYYVKPEIFVHTLLLP